MDGSYFPYVVAPVGTGDLAASILYLRRRCGIDIISADKFGGKTILVVPEREHPLSKYFKEFEVPKSLADKLVTNFMNEINRLMIEECVKESTATIVEVNNKDLKKAMKYGRIQGISAEPSGLAALSVLNPEFRRRNNLDIYEEAPISFYITGKYRRFCIETRTLFYDGKNCQIKKVIKRLDEEGSKNLQEKLIKMPIREAKFKLK